MTEILLNSSKKGLIAENIACRILARRGFEVIERNYRKKWGEIDIIARRSANDPESRPSIHFIEVKSRFLKNVASFSREACDAALSSGTRDYRPEENVHSLKSARLKRAMQSYMTEKGILERIENGSMYFLVHVIVVRIDLTARRFRASFIENVIL